MSKKVKFKEYTKDGKLLYTDGVEVWEQVELIGGVSSNEDDKKSSDGANATNIIDSVDGRN
ncbi:hypothetical protein D3C81_11340 [compost metagenome]